MIRIIRTGVWILCYMELYSIQNEFSSPLYPDTQVLVQKGIPWYDCLHDRNCDQHRTASAAPVMQHQRLVAYNKGS